MDSPSSISLNAPAATLTAGPTRLVEQFTGLPAGRKVTLVAGLLMLLALLVASVVWSTRPDWRVLFANLSDKDGGAIVAQLAQMNVPYRYSDGGGAVLVPADQVHDARLKLAQAGLPKGSVVGFELMDNARFGTTQFQERLNFQRGLEGELVRSITALSAVQAARVHLALPNQNGFFRDQQKPSASVLLTLHPGRSLERAQVAGIVHLVSASVPELTPSAVSVLDQSGALLSGAGEGGSGNNGLDPGQLQHVARLEASYAKRIVDLLEPVVGRDNLRAQVSADVDFSQTESTSEEFRPNQGGEPAAVRSMQVSENPGAAGSNVQPTGVPGAATNQPQAQPTAPINGAAQVMQAASGTPPVTAGTGAGAGGRRDALTNYEVDKTVRVTRAATGVVKRLAVAVVVNHRTVVDKKGQPRVQPLSAEELDKLTALVQETVGFSKDRGDSVRVVNAPFQVNPADTVEQPLWQRPQTVDMVRSLAAPVTLALLGLAVVFGVIRPVLRDARLASAARIAEAEKAAQEAKPRLDALVDDRTDLPPVRGALAGPTTSDQRIEAARQLARSNPAAVAQIVRGWMSGAD